MHYREREYPCYTPFGGVATRDGDMRRVVDTYLRYLDSAPAPAKLTKSPRRGYCPRCGKPNRSDGRGMCSSCKTAYNREYQANRKKAHKKGRRIDIAPTTPVKTCDICGKQKPLSEFAASKGGWKIPVCRTCSVL